LTRSGAITRWILTAISNWNIWTDARCTQGFFDWCESSEVMNKELYRGYNEDKTRKRVQNNNAVVSGFTIPLVPFCPQNWYLLIGYVTCILILTAYDLANSDLKKFNFIVQYNPDKQNMLRVARLMNLVTSFCQLGRDRISSSYLLCIIRSQALE